MTFEELKNNIAGVKKRVEKAANKSGRNASDIIIVAVTKTHPVDMIADCVKAGINALGENYAQELRDKIKYFEDNSISASEWHYIGHLQRNKVKYLIPHVEMIHSLDSLKLAAEISKQASKYSITQKILLQVNCSGELSKFGCNPIDAESLLVNIMKLDNLSIRGLMTIGSFSEDEKIYRREFSILRNLRDELQSKYNNIDLSCLSMGMTHDFEAAIEEGATIIRIGTAIFGQRNYKN